MIAALWILGCVVTLCFVVFGEKPRQNNKALRKVSGETMLDKSIKENDKEEIEE